MSKLFLSLLIGVSLVSCSDSDGNSGGNQVNVNGTTFNIIDAKAVDNFNFYSETHAEYNFVMASAPITIEAIPGSFFGFQTDNAKFALNLSIAALGDTFQNGVYQYDENMDFEQPNFNFFDGLTIYIDGNQDGEFNSQQDNILFATAGTVTVSGTAPNYILNFDVELSNGQNFNYTYNQGFDYVDNRN